MGNIGNASNANYSGATDPNAHFIRDVTEDFFTWIPESHRAAILARVTRQFWQHKAKSAVAVAADGLGECLDELINRIDSLDIGKPLAPRLSARLSGLIESIERLDGYAVLDALQAWSADPIESWYASDRITESIAIHDWEKPILREVRSTQIPDASPLEFFPLLERCVPEMHASIGEALGRIEQAAPAMHAEIQSHVSLVKLFRGNGIEGLSSPKVFGALWLKMPFPDNAQAWYLEHLVHECSHLYLNALLIVDPLLNNPQEMNKAPIRPDPRPMFQILHGTFVLARNCFVHSKLESLFPGLNLRPTLHKFREQYHNGLEVLNKHMQPTEMGKLLLESLNVLAKEV